MRFRKILIAAAALALSSAADAYVGQWHTYVTQTNVTSLLPYQGALFAGTVGGVRKIDPATFSETSYDNLDGLLDVYVTGLAVAGGRLWAVSQTGFVQEWDGKRFTPYGRAYASERWTMNLHAALGVGKYLVLGSEKGLTFFDTDKKLALVSLTRIGNLSGPSVLSLAAKGDTLFLGTVQGVYKAGLDWSNLLSDKVSIYDPNIWSQAVAPGKDDSIAGLDTLPDRHFESLAIVDGKLRYFPEGTYLANDHRIEAFTGRPPVIDGDTLRFPNIPDFVTAAEMPGVVFLGSARGLVASKNLKGDYRGFGLLPSTRKVPNDPIVNVAARGGHVYLQSAAYLYRKNGDHWDETPGYALPFSPDIAYWHLKNLSSDADGTVYVGSWGYGITRIRGGAQASWTHNTDPCMDTVVANFDVIHAISDIEGNSIWATVLLSDASARYQLVHFDAQREKISCLGLFGNGVQTHAVKPLSDTTVGVATENGIDVFKHAPGGAADFSFWKKLSASGQANETWDLARDAYHRVWAVLGDQIAYADSADTVSKDQPLTALDAFAGKECRIMENDAHQNLWVGCSNGLFRVVPAATIEGTRVDRFTADDGLLSPAILDLAVDKDNGQVWMATDRGVSMYESEVKGVPTVLGDFKVYPNPFRPNHRYVIFDNLPAGASVAIHTESGNVIRRFPSSQVQGNQCQWDGLNASGNKVSPGVYLYSVVSKSKTLMGKIIVAR